MLRPDATSEVVARQLPEALVLAMDQTRMVGLVTRRTPTKAVAGKRWQRASLRFTHGPQ